MSTDRPDVRSKKKTAKFWDDFCSDAKHDVAQERLDSPLVCPNLIEKYNQGRVAVHLHALGCFGIDTLIAGEFCLSFAKSGIVIGEGELLQHNGAGGLSDTGTQIANRCDKQSPVLVDIIQRLQMPEIGELRVRSVVGLQSFDNCLRSGTEVPDFAQAAFAEALLALKNRKGCLRNFVVSQRAFVSDRQGVDQMVKARPEILQAVPDQLGNQSWERSNDLSADDIIAGIRIEFIGNGIRPTFDPALNFMMEFMQVIFRTL